MPPHPLNILAPRVNSAPRFFSPPPLRELESSGAVGAVYVHVPFCTTKCHYCDFYSLAGHLHEAAAYLRALRREVRIQREYFGAPAPETIFIGGGTPTLLPPAQLASLLEIILDAVDTGRLREFTVEANPNTFDRPRARALRAAGVNRISFGAQSFVPDELQMLQRDHHPPSVPAAVDTARAAGIERINVDLIFGIPGQTPATLDLSLRRTLELEPEHISCYNLVYEPNTPLAAARRSGRIRPVPEALELAMFEQAPSRLGEHGYYRYEISNYARPGGECRHNIHCWRGGAYLGWGPSAASHHSGFRWKNVASLARYRDALAAPAPRLPIVQMERLAGMARWGELAILQLRLREGLDYALFTEKTGVNAWKILAPVRRKYEGLGVLADTPQSLILTAAAVAVSDTILADVLAAFYNAAEESR